jgi:glucokinase
MLLAADVGGTKTDLGLYTLEGGPRAPVAEAKVRSADYPSLEALALDFVARMGGQAKVTAACFDLAGPVRGERATVTNLKWTVTAEALALALGVRAVWLLNDLEAIALAVPLLSEEDVLTLHAGQPERAGAVAIVAPGTGLGEAFLTWNGTSYQAHPSEGGHSSFAPIGALQRGLLEYLSQRWEHVSVERVCSGMGLPNLYEYLRDSGAAPETPGVARRLAAAQDRTPIISEAALDPAGACPLCARTLALFVEILGAEAGNLGLKVMATAGIYVAGGVPRHILPALTTGRFLQALQQKGRLSPVVARMPVHVVTRSSALLGAASYGLARMRGE